MNLWPIPTRPAARHTRDVDRYIVVTDGRGPRLLIAVTPGGALSRYAGGGQWVPDGHMAQYLGLGGSTDGDDLDPADLDATMAALDARYAAARQGG